MTLLCDINWIKRKEPPRYFNMDGDSLNIVDLFCGCGGLSLGVAEAAIAAQRCPRVLFALDINQAALNVYRDNFSELSEQIVRNDINVMISSFPGEPLHRDEEELMDRYKGSVNILVAGPPCQGHSDLNNRTRRNDPRNLLYLKAIRFAELTLPDSILIENVPTVTNDKHNVVDQSISCLESLGYSTDCITVDATDFGLAQKRIRHVLVAKKGNTSFSHLRQPHQARSTSLFDYIADLEHEYLRSTDIFRTPSRMTKTNQERVRFMFENELYNLPNEMRPSCHKDKKHSYVSMYGRLRWDSASQTITSGFGSMGQGRFVHPSQKRVITPHEAARIQGFPDFFRFDSAKKRGHLQEMIGNAVPPTIVANLLYPLLKMEA